MEGEILRSFEDIDNAWFLSPFIASVGSGTGLSVFIWLSFLSEHPKTNNISTNYDNFLH
ncbi:MAG: hypothetical protein ACFFG0_57390 [Candidatus Thorarchaeota archaeon]